MECPTGQACVVRVPTADDPDAEVLICLSGAHPVEGVCGYCQRAADFALPEAEMCSDCVDIQFSKF
ncbi:hypothetical protein GCM10009578_091740 [Streptomyces rhizosphaericus]